MKPLAVQEAECGRETGTLRRDRGRSSPGRTHAARPHKDEIQHDVQHTSQRHEIERRARISQPTQNTAHDIIAYNKRNAHRTNPKIGFRVAHGLGGRVHPNGYLPVQCHHKGGQYDSHHGKEPDARPHDGSRLTVILRPRGNAYQHRYPRRKPENDARHSLHHLTSDGHGGHARGIVVPPHHKQVGSPIERLKHVGQ